MKVTPALPPAPAATPDNTPIPGGGSWRWDIALPGWVENTPSHYLQPGDTGALQTTDSFQE